MEGCPEWQLYNTSDENIQIECLQIRDKSGDISLFDLSISAGDYLVLTDDLGRI